MLRIRQLVSTVGVSLAAVTLVAPVAQARPADVSAGATAQSLPTRAHWGSGTFGRDSLIPPPATTLGVQPQNSRLKNQLSIPADAQTGLTAPSTDSGFDWTAAAVGAIVASLLGLLLAAGLNLRTRRVRHLAT